MLSALVALALAAAAPPVDAAQSHEARAVRVSAALNDDVWQTAEPIDAFIQREPAEAAAPSQRTEFRVAYDSTTLYVKVHAFDTEPGRVVGYLTRRDDNSPSDWIRVFIDSYHDRRTAYEFAVNPAGVKQDRYWFNDDDRDDSWDAVWNVKVSRDEGGWTAEFHIPFSQLRFTPSETNTFGFAVVREIARRNEIVTWPLLARSKTGFVSQFGQLGGLSMRASPKRLELMPYSVADLTRQRPEGNPLLSHSAGAGAIGLDLKYAVTSGLTLTTTINPDFGQVEADPAVVNLSAFETFFNERRPFFVEGSGNFRFDADCPDGPCQMFYSRRVGRPPQGTDTLPSGDGVYTNYPSQSTILGAAKLTGRIGDYSIGVLHAVTQSESAVVSDNNLRFDQPVEPLTDYTVARVRREFKNQSSVGGILTATNRQVPDSLRSLLPASSYTGGVDFDMRFRSRYSLAGFWAATTIRGDADAIALVQQNSRHYYQRPDATSFSFDPTRTSVGGEGGRIRIGKISGEHTRFNAEVGFKSPGFDLNEIGFMRRADERWMANWFQVRSDKPNKWFRSRNLNFNQFAMWNTDGDRLVSAQNVNGNVNFTNNWSAGGGIGVSQGSHDDRFTRGGPLVYTEGFDNFWSWLNTDDRKLFALGTFNGGGRNAIGNWFLENNVEITVRPLSALSVTTGARLNRATDHLQWTGLVTDSKDHYTFARLHQTTVGLTERLNYTMTPNLSLQLYAEPFVSGGTYNQFKELADPRNPVYALRYQPFAFDGNPDFDVKSFRTTNVLRWEYRPGSTLFVVWQQARENDAIPGGFRVGRDMHDIFAVAPKNVFLVKFSYWLNY